MSRERALLRRLDKAEADLRAVGGYENELQYIPAGGVRSLLADLRALLAEPEGEDVPEGLGPMPESVWVVRFTGDKEPTEYRVERERPTDLDEPWEHAEHYSLRPTPRSRAEGSDLSGDQGREFRVVDGLGDNNRAGKVTIDPTLLSPATPRSRAEAEAMVEAHKQAVLIMARGPANTDEEYAVLMRPVDDAAAALLAALTGGKG